MEEMNKTILHNNGHERCREEYGLVVNEYDELISKIFHMKERHRLEIQSLKQQLQEANEQSEYLGETINEYIEKLKYARDDASNQRSLKEGFQNALTKTKSAYKEAREREEKYLSLIEKCSNLIDVSNIHEAIEDSNLLTPRGEG